MAGYKWTDAQRQAQADRIRAQKPWLHTTGPKTEAGKDRASYNSWKTGAHSQNSRDMRAILKAQNNALIHIEQILKLETILAKPIRHRQDLL